MAGVKKRSGGKRRGAGRPPMSPEWHRLRGTSRGDRHASTGATALAPAPAPTAIGEVPAHLRPETQTWFAVVVATWVLDRHHRMILQAASWDQGQLAREAIDRNGVTVRTADGGCKGHPCLTIATAARGQFASLVAQLELDDAGTPEGHGR